MPQQGEDDITIRFLCAPSELRISSSHGREGNFYVLEWQTGSPGQRLRHSTLIYGSNLRLCVATKEGESQTQAS